MANYFFDPLSGERIAMSFDFGRGMQLRHEIELLATPAPIVGSDWGSATSADFQHEDAELPEGVDADNSGRYFTNCCMCGSRCNVTEFIDNADIDFTRWYGGCGPRCCP